MACQRKRWQRFELRNVDVHSSDEHKKKQKINSTFHTIWRYLFDFNVRTVSQYSNRSLHLMIQILSLTFNM